MQLSQGSRVRLRTATTREPRRFAETVEFVGCWLVLPELVAGHGQIVPGLPSCKLV